MVNYEYQKPKFCIKSLAVKLIHWVGGKLDLKGFRLMWNFFIFSALLSLLSNEKGIFSCFMWNPDVLIIVAEQMFVNKKMGNRPKIIYSDYSKTNP